MRRASTSSNITEGGEGFSPRQKALVRQEMTEVFAAKRADREPTHPGVILREDVLPSLGVTVTEFARMLDVGRQQLHRILSGESSISPEMALKLGKLCGNGPEFWINMQVAVDLWRARKELGARLDAIQEIGPCA